VLGRICSPGTRLCFGSLSLSGHTTADSAFGWQMPKLKNVALRSPRHSQKLTAYHAVEPARGHEGTGRSVSR
jgi:hypothetical protein